MRSYAVTFATIHSSDGRARRYPILPVLLDLHGLTRPVGLLVDSGSDRSFLTHALITRMFGLHLEDLPEGPEQQGYGGTFRTVALEGTVRFGSLGAPFVETIPFLVARDAGIDPSFSVLGREPFFERYRVDFRMGLRRPATAGRFVITTEKVVAP